MNKNTLISAILLSTTMVLNTGCIQRFFVDEKPPSKTIKYESQAVVPNRQLNNTDIECSEDLTTKKSDCDRGTISREELKHNPKTGEQHLLQSIRGKIIHIGERSNGFTFPEYKNKVVILEIFGKDCPHCIREIPVLQSIRKRYRGKLEIIAIQAQDRMSRNEARNYINKHRIRYPIIEGDDATNLQYFIQETYGWRGILPYTLVIKDGITEFSYSGETDYSELKHDIDSLFKQ
ncbi:MAG: TlpA family protein disulfide reductase [Epsilonproteobacteria bacterium]|nr:TlpA family protein disulfide reductase [Campylobacterota bacterium]